MKHQPQKKSVFNSYIVVIVSTIVILQCDAFTIFRHKSCNVHLQHFKTRRRREIFNYHSLSTTNEIISITPSTSTTAAFTSPIRRSIFTTFVSSSSSSTALLAAPRMSVRGDIFLRTRLHAKKKRLKKSSADSGEQSDWYESVSADASPDDVFWEELERQKLLNTQSDTNPFPDDAYSEGPSYYDQPPEPYTGQTLNFGGGDTGGAENVNFPDLQSLARGQQPPSVYGEPNDNYGNNQQQSARTIDPDRVLSKLAYLAVKSNYLEVREESSGDENDDNENLHYDGIDINLMEGDEEFDEEIQKRIIDFNEQVDDMLEEAERQESGGDNAVNNKYKSRKEREIWDFWAHSNDIDVEFDEEEDEAHYLANGIGVYGPDIPSQPTQQDVERAVFNKANYMSRLSNITLTCSQLRKAIDNQNAHAYFNRDFDPMEYYDTMWISAIDHASYKNLVGDFTNYGIQFAHNFGDWEDGSQEDAYRTLEELAAFKAISVYNATGLPCIASRCGFEVEPARSRAPNKQQQKNNAVPGSRASQKQAMTNPRMAMGYRINNVDDRVDDIINALKTSKNFDPNRLTKFRTVLCFYDGEEQIFDYGECYVDLIFADSVKNFVPVSVAIREMKDSLVLLYGLEYEKWLKRETVGSIYKSNFLDEDEDNEEISSDNIVSNKASLKLRDRVLKEGSVLPNEIIDVSQFMDSMVDVNLMDECGIELANRFIRTKPTKILTIATTGLIAALPIARQLNIPVVYARKERSVVMSNPYRSTFKSRTLGTSRELFVSKEHLNPNDRILIVDDFLSSGSSQEALLRIVGECNGAVAVGIATLIEKVYESGRRNLSGFDIPIESLVKVVSVEDRIIRMEEEDGYEDYIIQNY